MFKKRKNIEYEHNVALEKNSSDKDKEQVKIQFFIREEVSKNISKALNNLQEDIRNFLAYYPEAKVIDIKFNVTYKNNDMEVVCIGLLIYQ